MSPLKVIEVYGKVPNAIHVNGLGEVMAADVGWKSPDQNYRLVSVVAFVPAGGRTITGNPSYSVDTNGVVTETFATIPTPPIVLSWTPAKITRALQSINKAKADLFFSKMADSDRAKFIASESVRETDAILLTALAEPSVGITLAELKVAILALPNNGV